MAEHPVHDDSSHYEISLTAGQAFIAFILLLCSLGAAFAFGVLVGRGQLDERLVVQREPSIISEGAPADDSRIVDLGVDDDFSTTESAPAVPPPEILEKPAVVERTPLPATLPRTGTAAPAPPAAGGPVVAQVASGSEARPAEALAARLIDSGFPTAYVERVQTDGGMIYRVRVRFASEAEARAASARLGELAGGEVWITRP